MELDELKLGGEAVGWGSEMCAGLTPSPGPNVLLLSFMVGTNHLL